MAYETTGECDNCNVSLEEGHDTFCAECFAEQATELLIQKEENVALLGELEILPKRIADLKEEIRGYKIHEESI